MTGTDTAFGARFPDITATTFNGNSSELSGWTPSPSTLNTGLMSDIGRATIYDADTQPNFWARYMRDPLSRGDASLKAAVKEVTGRPYKPDAPDTDLFNGSQPGFYTDVAKKNFSRQIAVEINDHMLKQYAQTDEMIGYVESAIMGVSNVCYQDDMWVASTEFFSGSTRNARTDQSKVLTKGATEAGYGEEIIEALWDYSINKFQFKSTKYNASQRNTRSEDISIVLKSSVQYPAFKKLLSETFNPDILESAIKGGISYVEDFATPAGKPAQSGELIGMVIDNRAFDIIPMPDALTVEAFRNPARKSTAYFTTYEYAFQHSPFFNVGYIYDKAP